MKIEILKSTKGNEQKQNKPAKPPNPKSPKARQAHMPRKDKAREKKATLRLGYLPKTALNVYYYILMNGSITKKGRGDISLKPNSRNRVIQIRSMYYT